MRPPEKWKIPNASSVEPVQHGQKSKCHDRWKLAQERSNSTTSPETTRRGTFRAVANAVVSEEQPANLEYGPLTPPTSEQVIEHTTISGIRFHVEETVHKLELEIAIAQHEEVDNCLPASSEILIERILKRVINSAKFIGRIVEAIIDNYAFLHLRPSTSNRNNKTTTTRKRK